MTVPSLAQGFLTAAAENGMVVHGPLDPAPAAQLAAARAVEHAAGRAVAVPMTDPLVEALGLRGLAAQAYERVPETSSDHLDAQLADGVRATGESGTLLLDRHGGARVRFDVRATDHEGRLHVRFGSIDPAFERAWQALLDTPREARRA